MATNLTPGTTPPSGMLASQPKGNDSAQSGRPSSDDPTLEPGNYGPSLFGVPLPQGTGAPGSAGAGNAADPTNEPGQLDEGLSGLGPSVTADTGAPGSAGQQNSAGGGTAITYTNPGSFLGGTYTQDTVTDDVSGVNDWTQAIDGSYGGKQIPGLNMPMGTGAGEGTILKGGRDVGP
jgi:hypothetical protein